MPTRVLKEQLRTIMRARRTSNAAAVWLLAWSLLFTSCVVTTRRPFPGPPPTPPAVTDFDVALAPHGDFIVVAGVGRVWRPHLAVVGPEFVPYLTGGRWVYTSAGWLFESRWDFGWAVFHYGHWMEVASIGWVWVPGNEWAPAWVEWQTGGGYVAWAPMPPPFVVVDWRPRWCFVETRLMVTEHWIEHHVHVLPPGAVHPGRPVMVPIARAPGRPVAIGPPPAYVERNAGVPVRIHEAVPPPPHGVGRVKVREWSPLPPRPWCRLRQPSQRPARRPR